MALALLPPPRRSTAGSRWSRPTGGRGARLSEGADGGALRLVPDRTMPAARRVAVAGALRRAGARAVWIVTERGQRGCRGAGCGAGAWPRLRRRSRSAFTQAGPSHWPRPRRRAMRAGQRTCDDRQRFRGCLGRFGGGRGRAVRADANGRRRGPRAAMPDLAASPVAEAVPAVTAATLPGARAKGTTAAVHAQATAMAEVQPATIPARGAPLAHCPDADAPPPRAARPEGHARCPAGQRRARQAGRRRAGGRAGHCLPEPAGQRGAIGQRRARRGAVCAAGQPPPCAAARARHPLQRRDRGRLLHRPEGRACGPVGGALFGRCRARAAGAGPCPARRPVPAAARGRHRSRPRVLDICVGRSRDHGARAQGRRRRASRWTRSFRDRRFRMGGRSSMRRSRPR